MLWRVERTIVALRDAGASGEIGLRGGVGHFEDGSATKFRKIEGVGVGAEAMRIERIGSSRGCDHGDGVAVDGGGEAVKRRNIDGEGVVKAHVGGMRTVAYQRSVESRWRMKSS